MKGRAVTMERRPDGWAPHRVYQKRAPNNLPDAVPRVSIAGPPAGADVDYVVGGTRKTLLILVNLGCIADARHELPCRRGG